MNKVNTARNLVLLVLIASILTVAILKVVPLREIHNSLDQYLTADLKNSGRCTFNVQKGCFVIGSFDIGSQSLTNTTSWYIFEPDEKTLVSTMNIDLQHDLEGRFSTTFFNFTANVDGNYVFLANATFLDASLPQAQRYVTMHVIATESGVTTIL